MSKVEAFYKTFTGDEGEPLTGVRYTEHRLAACFEEGADGFHILKLLAHQQLTVHQAAGLIQKVLKGHRLQLAPVDYTKKLESYLK